MTECPPTFDDYVEKHGEKPKPGTILRCGNPECDKTFVYPARVAIRKYCCTPCKDHSLHLSQPKRVFDLECPICGTKHQKPHPRYIYCSDECRAKGHAGFQRTRHLINSVSPEELIRQQERAAYERKLVEGLGRTAILAEMLKDYIDRFPAGSIRPLPYKPRKGKTAETMVILRSDLHPGLVTPSYSLEVFRERMERYTDRVLRIRDIISETIPIERLVIFNLGDNITGQGIFPNQPWKTEKHVLEQIYGEAAPAIISQNRTWAEYFPAVEEYWVPGNHGRTGREYPDEVNFDSILAQEVAARMEKIKHYTVHIEWGWWQYAEIYGFRFLLLHGHQIRSWLNIPFYGLIQKGMRWQGSMPDRWDYLVHGHFHVPFCFPWNNFSIIGNGTLVSDDEFALRELGMASEPAQQVFGVHPEHGVTWRYILQLDDREIEA